MRHEASEIQQSFMRLASLTPSSRIGDLIVKSLAEHRSDTASVYLLLGDPALRVDLPSEVKNVGGSSTGNEQRREKAEGLRAAVDRLARTARGDGGALLPAAAGESQRGQLPQGPDQLVDATISAMRSISSGTRVAEPVSTSANPGQKFKSFPRGCARTTRDASSVSARIASKPVLQISAMRTSCRFATARRHCTHG